jgi:3-oxoacyl-[acyl-carrier protein] reductase
MDLGLTGRRVLVTGGSTGIGRATAVTFAREGANVAITCNRDIEGARETARMVEAAGAKSLVVQYDLGNDESIRSAVEHVTGRWNGIDVLVNNALQGGSGGSLAGAPRFEDVPPEQWREKLRTSIEGVYLTIQCVLPAMRSAPWGRIVNVSSSLVERGLAGAGAYIAAKASLHGLTRTLAWELGPEGILVNVVMPGLTLTERTLRTRSAEMLEQVARESPTGRLTRPEEVATVIAFLGSAANGHINGEMIRVTGGA